MTGGLQVLSLTNSLRNRDFDNFRRIAMGFLEQYGKEGVVLVADREGRHLFSSVTEDTASLPPRNNRDIVEKVFATRQPQYSNLFIGAVKKRLIVTVEVPVFRDGEVVSVISFSPPIEIFQALIEKQRPSQDWTSFDLRPRRASISRGCRTRRKPSASAPRRRCSPPCRGPTKPLCRRCRSKACR